MDKYDDFFYPAVCLASVPLFLSFTTTIVGQTFLWEKHQLKGQAKQIHLIDGVYRGNICCDSPSHCCLYGGEIYQYNMHCAVSWQSVKVPQPWTWRAGNSGRMRARILERLLLSLNCEWKERRNRNWGVEKAKCSKTFKKTQSWKWQVKMSLSMIHLSFSRCITYTENKYK